jgi:hypothetical protein
MIQAAIAITGTNTQDEVECEYIKEVDENISEVDKTFALNVVYWMFAFTLMSVSVFYGLTWVQNVPPLTDDIKSNIFKILIGIGTILFIIFVSLFFSKSMNVNYGATSIFSLYIVAIASYALIGGLRH